MTEVIFGNKSKLITKHFGSITFGDFFLFGGILYQSTAANIPEEATRVCDGVTVGFGLAETVYVIPTIRISWES